MNEGNIAGQIKKTVIIIFFAQTCLNTYQKETKLFEFSQHLNRRRR